jgi:hypothetical protein
MPAMSANFYYAGGEKINLHPVKDMLAFARPTSLSKLPAALKQSLHLGLEAVTDGVTIVPVEQLTSQVLSAIRDKLKVFPVFAGDASGMLVALPEIRVQCEPEQGKKLESWLKERADEIDIVKHDGTQFVLQATSGDGADALRIANEIYRKFRPQMSQPRFIRIVDRPDTMQPRA